MIFVNNISSRHIILIDQRVCFYYLKKNYDNKINQHLKKIKQLFKFKFFKFFIFDHDNYFRNIDKNVFKFIEIDDAQKIFVYKFQILFFRECFCDAIDMSVLVH